MQKIGFKSKNQIFFDFFIKNHDFFQPCAQYLKQTTIYNQCNVNNCTDTIFMDDAVLQDQQHLLLCKLLNVDNLVLQYFKPTAVHSPRPLAVLWQNCYANTTKPTDRHTVHGLTVCNIKLQR